MADLTAMLQAAAGNVGGDYQIERSLRFNSADSAYLSRTPASAGNRKTWTWSGWVKRSGLTTTNFSMFSAGTADGSVIRFQAAGQIRLYDYDVGASAFIFNLITTPVYLDPSSWYHLVVAVDTTQATSSDRVKIYINGEQVTALSTAVYPSLNDDCYAFNNNVAHAIGVSSWTAANYFSGYLADIHFVDGQQLTPSSFGEVDSVTGVWKPIRYAGTYGTNGFHLDFSDNSSTTALGYDAAGSNDWTPNNFSVTAGAGNDSLVDSPTQYGTDTGAGGEVRGNYCTWNPLDKNNGTGFVNNGNLDASDSNTAGTSSGVRSTLGASSGKWYFEVTVSSLSGNSGNNVMIGVSDLNYPLSSAGWGSANAWTYYASNGNKYNGGSSSAYGATYTQNDVIGVAVDSDNGTLTFYKNGVSQGQAYSGLTGKNLAPYFGTAFEVMVVTLNTGQRPFAYTAPSGFKALCTTNLPDPTVLQGGDYFNTVLYTGNGTTQSITGVGFQPDFVWIKERSSTSGHQAQDAVRGTGAVLYINETTAEYTGQTAFITSFDSDGFSLGNGGSCNESAQTYVGWNWKANGAGVSNTAGTITSTVSANTTAGISIVTYTGTGSAATVGHGLGAAPRMIIVKNRDQADAWQVYHAANTANPETDYLVLNTTAGTADAADRWNDTLPTSTVFSIGNGVEVNTNTEKYVAYCFAEVEGFSKFGSYTGNGSADGPFVYTGFRPAWVMVKSATLAGYHWYILDSARNTYNPEDKYLLPSSSSAEATYIHFDFLSNGFKIVNTGAGHNNSGTTYIYMAFAENPFKNALAR